MPDFDTPDPITEAEAKEQAEAAKIWELIQEVRSSTDTIQAPRKTRSPVGGIKVTLLHPDHGPSTLHIDAIDFQVGHTGELIITDEDHDILILAAGQWRGLTGIDWIDLR